VYLEDGAAASLPNRPRSGQARRVAVADHPVVVRNPIAPTPRHDGSEPAHEEALRKLTLYVDSWSTDDAPKRQVTGHVAMASPEQEQAQGVNQAEATPRPTGHGADRGRPLEGAMHRGQPVRHCATCSCGHGHDTGGCCSRHADASTPAGSPVLDAPPRPCCAVASGPDRSSAVAITAPPAKIAAVHQNTVV